MMPGTLNELAPVGVPVEAEVLMTRCQLAAFSRHYRSGKELLTAICGVMRIERPEPLTPVLSWVEANPTAARAVAEYTWQNSMLFHLIPAEGACTPEHREPIERYVVPIPGRSR